MLGPVESIHFEDSFRRHVSFYPCLKWTKEEKRTVHCSWKSCIKGKMDEDDSIDKGTHLYNDPEEIMVFANDSLIFLYFFFYSLHLLSFVSHCNFRGGQHFHQKENALLSAENEFLYKREILVYRILFFSTINRRRSQGVVRVCGRIICR